MSCWDPFHGCLFLVGGFGLVFWISFWSHEGIEQVSRRTVVNQYWCRWCRCGRSLFVRLSSWLISCSCWCVWNKSSRDQSSGGRVLGIHQIAEVHDRIVHPVLQRPCSSASVKRCLWSRIPSTMVIRSRKRQRSAVIRSCYPCPTRWLVNYNLILKLLLELFRPLTRCDCVGDTLTRRDLERRAVFG